MNFKIKLFIAILTSVAVIILGILLLVFPEAFPFTEKISQIYAFFLFAYAAFRIYRIIKSIKENKS